MLLDRIRKKRFCDKVLKVQNASVIAKSSITGESNPIRAKKNFVQMALKEGFLSPNPKPLDSVSVEFIVKDKNTIRIETWQDLCESEHWFYAASIRPLQTRYFMFCFDLGVVIYSKKQSQGLYVTNAEIVSQGVSAFAQWSRAAKNIEILKPIELTYIAIPSGSDLSDPLHTDLFFYQYIEFLKSESNKIEAEKRRERQREREARIAEKESADRARWTAENTRQAGILEEKLGNKKDTLQHSLDTDKNGDVDVIESSLLMPVIRKHQKKIQQVNSDFIQNFIKLENHLKLRRSGVQNFYAALMSWQLPAVGSSKQDISRVRGSLRKWNEQHERLSQELGVYSAIQYNAIHMVNAIVNDDMVTYYEIYEAFDDLGIWHTNYEQLSIAQLNELNDNVRRLIEVNIASTELISKGLFDITLRMKEQNHLLHNLEESMREGFSDLSSNVSSGLSEVNGTLRAGNLLRMVNTYQLYKVNQKLKG